MIYIPKKTNSFLQQKIRKTVILSISIKAGKPTQNKYKKAEILFDESGNQIEYIEYKQGKIEKWQKYKYDKLNRMIESSWLQTVGYKKEETREYVTKYQYDTNGKIVAENKVIEGVNENNLKTETVYYLNGTIKSKKTFNSEGICFEEEEYQKEKIVRKKLFNNSGLCIEDYKYDTKGNSLNYVLYEYDFGGNPIRIKKVSRTGYISQDRTLVYDSNGNLTEDVDTPKPFSKGYIPNMTIIRFDDENEDGYNHKYFYDEKSLLKQHFLFLGNTLIMKHEYIYEHY